MTSANTSAAWLSDPDDPSQLRYWDGFAWTEHRAAQPSPSPMWKPDPDDLLQQRYWDGLQWTDHVQPISDIAIAALIKDERALLASAENRCEIACDSWTDSLRAAILQYAEIPKGEPLGKFAKISIWETSLEYNGKEYPLTPQVSVRVERVGSATKTQGWVLKETTDDREDHIYIEGPDWAFHTKQRASNEWSTGTWALGDGPGRKGGQTRDMAAAIRGVALKSDAVRARLRPEFELAVQAVTDSRCITVDVAEALSGRDTARRRAHSIAISIVTRKPHLHPKILSEAIGLAAASGTSAESLNAATTNSRKGDKYQQLAEIVRREGLRINTWMANKKTLVALTGDAILILNGKDVRQYNLSNVAALGSVRRTGSLAFLLTDGSVELQHINMGSELSAFVVWANTLVVELRTEVAFVPPIWRGVANAFDGVESTTVPTPRDHESDLAMLAKLAELHASGIVTAEEFQAKKVEILARM